MPVKDKVIYRTVRVAILPLHAIIEGEEGENEPGFVEYDQIEDRISIGEIIKKLSPPHRKVVKLLIVGYNFNQIGKKLSIKPSQVYKIKGELQKELAYLKAEPRIRKL